MHTAMQHQEHMRLRQEEMLRQRQEIAAIARLGYQGNANNNASFGQLVWEAAGLAFDDASIPANGHMVDDGD
jgi:predicted metal-binding transcription factor (methanogenesis marker protein 9)